MALTLAIALEHRGVDNPYFQTPQTLKLVESCWATVGIAAGRRLFPGVLSWGEALLLRHLRLSVSETLLRIGNQIDPVCANSKGLERTRG